MTRLKISSQPVTGHVRSGKMKMKFEHMLATLALGILSWGALQVYQMNASVSLIAYKVDENYKMIKPMWEDYIVRTVGIRQVKSEK